MKIPPRFKSKKSGRRYMRTAKETISTVSQPIIGPIQETIESTKKSPVMLILAVLLIAGAIILLTQSGYKTKVSVQYEVASCWLCQVGPLTIDKPKFITSPTVTVTNVNMPFGIFDDLISEVGTQVIGVDLYVNVSAMQKDKVIASKKDGFKISALATQKGKIEFYVPLGNYTIKVDLKDKNGVLLDTYTKTK